MHLALDGTVLEHAGRSSLDIAQVGLSSRGQLRLQSNQPLFLAGGTSRDYFEPVKLVLGVSELHLLRLDIFHIFLGVFDR